MARTLLQKAQVSPWVYLGDLPNDSFREADIHYVNGAYHVFSTWRAAPSTCRVFKASTLDGILHATPFVTAATNSVNISSSVDNGNGTVTLTHGVTSATAFSGTILRVTGHAAYSANNQWVIGTRIDSTHTSVPGTSTGGTGGSFRITINGQYPTAYYDSAANLWHLWAVNGTSAITQRWTTADPITDSSVWTFAQSDAFGAGQQIIDAQVRKHPTDGFFYAVGFVNTTDSPLMILRATAAAGPWTVLAADVYADIGEPWWADTSRPDPNLAFTADGKAWVLHTGFSSTDSHIRSGMVEISLTTGKATGTAVVLNTDGDLPWQQNVFSDLNYLAVPGEPERIFGFVNQGDFWPAAVATTGWGAIALTDPPAGVDERVWVWDRYGSGTFYDISAWVYKYPAQISGKAEGQVAQLALTVLPYNKAHQPLPCQLVGGQEIIYYTWDPNPAYYQYKPSGKVNQLIQVPTPGGMAIEVHLEGYERELNAHASFVYFGDEARYDKDRIQALFETKNVADGNTWDAHTAVQGPFRDYLGSPQGFYRTNLWNILKVWAQDPAATSANGVPSFRRWYTTAAWSDPSNPGTGVLKRVLHYYESLTGLQFSTPLTERRDRVVNLINETFARPDYPSLGATTSGQLWEYGAGVWAIESNTAKLMTSTPGGLQYAAYLDAGVSSGYTVSVDFATNNAPMRLIWRVNPEPGETWKWSGLVVENNGTGYTVRRYSAGVFTNLLTIAVSPAAGDKVEVSLPANSSTHAIKIYRSGGSVAYTGSVTDTMNLNSTRVGLSIDSIQPSRWDNLKVVGKGLRYYGWRRVLDYTSLANIMAIAGPGGDPAQIEWQNGQLVDIGTGFVAKQDVAAWQASHTYITGDRVKPLANPNGRQYRATVGGTNGATEPVSWPLTEGTTVTDGGVTWICDTFNAGATSKTPITEDGGYITYQIQEHTVGSDTMTRPDGPPGNLETGQTWATYNGSWTITGNRLRPVNAPGTIVFESGIGSSVIVQSVFASLQVGMRLVFRSVDALNLWYVDAQATSYRIVKRVANVDTVMATVAQTPVAGDVVKVSGREGLVSLYINGTFKTSVTDAWLMGATKHGMSVPLDGSGTYPARFGAFNCWQTYTTKQLGWSASTSFDLNAAFAIRMDTNGTAQVYEGGVAKGTSTGAVAGDSFQIEIRPTMDPATQTPRLNVNYYKWAAGTSRGDVWYTSTTHPTITAGVPYFANAALYHVGARFAGVMTRRFSYALYSDPVSIARYGRWWAKELVQDDLLDTNAKRQSVANSIFARYAYPRDTMEVYVRQPSGWEWGRRVLVNNTALGWTDVLRVITEVKPAKKGSGGPTVLLLGDSPYEYGTDEPLGPLFRAPDRDIAAPDPPVGFATGVTRRDGAITVSVASTWTVPSDDAITLEVELTKVATGTDAARYSFPARAGAGLLRLLEPSTAYRPAVRMVDSNNNRSDWVIYPDFTTGAITPLPAPTSLAVQKQGVGPNYTVWVQVGWTPPGVPVGADALLTPPSNGIDHYLLSWQPWINGPIYTQTVDGSQSRATITGLASTGSYRIWVTAYDNWGQPGIDSAVITFVPTPPPMRGAGSLPLDTIHQDLLESEAGTGAFSAVPGWRWIQQPTGATMSVSRDFVLRGGYSIKLVVPASAGASTVEIEQDPEPVTPDEWYWAWLAYYVPSGSAPTTLQDRNVWADKDGVLIGSVGVIRSVSPPGVAAWGRFYMGSLQAPSVARGYAKDAVISRRRVLVTFPSAGGTIYLAPPMWDVTMGTEQYHPDIQTNSQFLYDANGVNRLSLTYVTGTDTTQISAANSSSNTKSEVRGVGDVSLVSTSGRTRLVANTGVPNLNIGALRTSNPSAGVELEGDVWVWDDGSGLLKLKVNRGGSTLGSGVNKTLAVSNGGLSIYRAFVSTTSTVNPEPSSDTDVNGMSVSFTLEEARDVLIIFDARYSKSAGTTRVNVYDNANGGGFAQIAPDNTSIYSGFYGTGPGPDGGQQAVRFVTLQTGMAAGTHVVKVMHQAAASTVQIQWGDRLLVAQVLG